MTEKEIIEDAKYSHDEDEIKLSIYEEKMNRITNMTDEEKRSQLEWSDPHEFSYDYCLWLLRENEILKQKINVLKYYKLACFSHYGKVKDMNSKVFIRIKDKNSGKESKEVTIEDVIFNQHDIEFEFPDFDEYGDASLPYKDFLFYRDDYDVIVKIK